MSDQRLLPCGSDLSQLIEQVVQGHGLERTDHQASCPFCQTALDELSRRWAGVVEYRDKEVRPPPRVLTRIMRRVWATVDDQWVQILDQGGLTEVSTRVLGTVCLEAAAALDDITGVRRVEVRKDPEAAAVSVALDVSVRFDRPLESVTQAVQRSVGAALWQMCGTAVIAFDLRIVDISL